MEKEFQRIMDDSEGRFRGHQRAIIEAIVRGEERVLAIIPTGGTSLLFQLPALCEEGGVTMVVIPLIALQQDLHRRCRTMGMECREWNRRAPPDQTRIVLVTREWRRAMILCGS